MHTDTFDYADGETTCEGVFMHGGGGGRRPCVLVFHAWHGQGEHELACARRMAEAGYLALAADVYGKGVRGNPGGDNSHLMGPFIEDRARLRRRLLAAVETARSHPLADPDRIAAVGYCFGGLCALDLARANAPGLRASVSFHGVFAPPALGEQPPIAAKVLVCHGWDDPFAPPEDAVKLAAELTAARADWQLLAFGGVSHAFTDRRAQAREAGLLYDAGADRRSWRAAMDLLGEAFGAEAPR